MPSTMRRACWLGWLTGLALVLAVLVPPAHAQFDSGQISGFVKDEQGGVVPGATVRVINEQTQDRAQLHHRQHRVLRRARRCRRAATRSRSS